MTVEEKPIVLEVETVVHRPDEWYVEAASGGDREAFDQLVRRHQQSVINAAAYYLGHQEDALEVAQESFLKAYRSLERFKGKASFRTWLLRITLNTARSFHAHRQAIKRSGTTATISISASGEKEDQGGLELSDSSGDPHELLERKELQQLIEDAIQSLDDRNRRIIILRDILGESYQAIADEEGLTLGTVKTRVHRARLELREIIGDFL